MVPRFTSWRLHWRRAALVRGRKVHRVDEAGDAPIVTDLHRSCFRRRGTSDADGQKVRRLVGVVEEPAHEDAHADEPAVTVLTSPQTVMRPAASLLAAMRPNLALGGSFKPSRTPRCTAAVSLFESVNGFPGVRSSAAATPWIAIASILDAPRCDNEFEAAGQPADVVGTKWSRLLGSPRLHDEDGDEESDPLDRCPDTPPRVEVDDSGCSQAQFCAQFDAATRDGEGLEK